MTTRQSSNRNWRSLAAAATCVLTIGGALAISDVASGQDQTAAAAKDAIFARKIAMDTIGRNMDVLEEMTSSGKIDLAEGKEHADVVSVLLMAFPHLFLPSTNQWKPNVERDPGTDTFAAPELWTNFSDFYARAAAASKTAFRASRAKDEDTFKSFMAELRVACDSCHAIYLKNE